MSNILANFATAANRAALDRAVVERVLTIALSPDFDKVEWTFEPDGSATIAILVLDALGDIALNVDFSNPRGGTARLSGKDGHDVMDAIREGVVPSIARAWLRAACLPETAPVSILAEITLHRCLSVEVCPV